MINIPHNGSALRRVHTASGILRMALETLPAWRDTYAAMERLAAAPTTTNTAPVADNVAAFALDAVRAGKPVPGDLEEQAGRAVLQLQARQGVIEGLQRANSELVGELDEAVMAGKAKLYAFLNDQLDTVFDAAVGLGDVSALLAAETVLATRRVEDHEAWTVLAGRYAGLRQAQATLDQALDTPLAGVIEPAMEAKVMPGVEDAFPEWRAWRTHGYLVDPSTGSRRPLSPPWPAPRTSDPRNLKVSEASSPEFFAWAVDAEAGLWIPTPTQLVAEQERLSRVLRAYRDDQSLMHTPSADPAPQYVDPNTVRGKASRGAKGRAVTV